MVVMIERIWRYVIARMLIRNGYDPGGVERFYGEMIYNFVFGIKRESKDA